MTAGASPPDADLLLRGLAAGALLTTGLGVLRGPGPKAARGTILLACLSLAAWIISVSPGLCGALAATPLGAAIASAMNLAAAPAGALFWMLILTVFADQPLPRLVWLPAGLFLLCGLSQPWLPPGPANGVMLVSNLLNLALQLHGLVVVASGWQGDLLGERRLARALVLGLGASFGLFEIGTTLLPPAWGAPHFLADWHAGGVGGAALLAAITLAAATGFLTTRPTLFAPPPPVSASPDRGSDATRAEAAHVQAARAAADTAANAEIARLTALMQAGAWRQEGLTIGQLAERLGLPEHRLRPLINDRLGHRNFAEFLNTWRIAAARARLADPAEARTTIAAIAYDLGFGSLGPFNRAFRAATGETPTDWRRNALARAASPFPQNPDSLPNQPAAPPNPARPAPPAQPGESPDTHGSPGFPP